MEKEIVQWGFGEYSNNGSLAVNMQLTPVIFDKEVTNDPAKFRTELGTNYVYLYSSTDYEIIVDINGINQINPKNPTTNVYISFIVRGSGIVKLREKFLVQPLGTTSIHWKLDRTYMKANYYDVYLETFVDDGEGIVLNTVDTTPCFNLYVRNFETKLSHIINKEGDDHAK